MTDPLQSASDWFNSLPEDFKVDIAYSAYDLRIFSCIQVGKYILGAPARTAEEKASTSTDEEVQKALEDMNLLFSCKEIDLIDYLQRLFVFKGYVSFYFSGKSTYFDWEDTAKQAESFKRSLIESGKIDTQFYDKHLLHHIGETAQKWIPVGESWIELLDGDLSDKAVSKLFSETLKAAGQRLSNPD